MCINNGNIDRRTSMIKVTITILFDGPEKNRLSLESIQEQVNNWLEEVSLPSLTYFAHNPENDETEDCEDFSLIVEEE